MPTYTMTLREAIEVTGGTTVYVDGQTILANSNIGLEHYPIFDEVHRQMLNSHIVDEYWNDEIAHETVAIFRQRLSAHMFLHMPTFNKRYELALKEFDPLVTMQILTKGAMLSRQTASSEANTSSANTASSEASSSGTSDATAGSRSVFSDTPGVLLSGNADYATNASDLTNYTDSESDSHDASTSESETDSHDTGTSESETDGTTESETSGYNGEPADILRRAQEAILNIDLMVVDSLQHLFFGLWSNSDEFPTLGR